MTLALEFGRADVGRFLSEITLDEFNLWQAYYLKNPWGERRADERQLALVMFLAKLMSGEESGIDVQPNYPYFKDEAEEFDTTVDNLRMMTAIFAEHPNYVTLPQIDKQRIQAEFRSRWAAMTPVEKKAATLSGKTPRSAVLSSP